MPFEIRDVTDLAGCRAVVDVENEVWGQDSEVVPASLLVASIKRGGILIGAWDGSRLVGFVWSMPGVRQGQLTHWSHMLGVRPEARGQGLGESLKRVQSERAIAASISVRHCSGSARSVGTEAAMLPCAVQALATSSSRCALRAASTKFSPRRESSSAKALPMPSEAPVRTTTRPDSGLSTRARNVPCLTAG